MTIRSAAEARRTRAGRACSGPKPDDDEVGDHQPEGHAGSTTSPDAPNTIDVAQINHRNLTAAPQRAPAGPDGGRPLAMSYGRPPVPTAMAPVYMSQCPSRAAECPRAGNHVLHHQATGPCEGLRHPLFVGPGGQEPGLVAVVRQ